MSVMKLTDTEKATIEKLIKSYGLLLEGGSSEITGGGEIVYHMSIRTYSGAKTYGGGIGPKLKEALHADKIYFSGERVA